LVFITQIEARSKGTEYEIGKGLVWFVRFGEEKRFLPLSGISSRSLSSSLYASYCTHCAVPAAIKSQKNWWIFNWGQRLLQMWIF